MYFNLKDKIMLQDNKKLTELITKIDAGLIDENGNVYPIDCYGHVSTSKILRENGTKGTIVGFVKIRDINHPINAVVEFYDAEKDTDPSKYKFSELSENQAKAINNIIISSGNDLVEEIAGHTANFGLSYMDKHFYEYAGREHFDESNKQYGIIKQINTQKFLNVVPDYNPTSINIGIANIEKYEKMM